MAKWWKFGRGKDKGEGQAPGPTPTPAPTPSEDRGGEKKGLLGRLFGRGKKKEKEKAPAAPEAPPAPPGVPPTGPTAPSEGGEPSEGEGAGGEEKEKERVYPGSLGVSADGDWVISSTSWSGIMQGVLHGQDVKTFIDAMEAGDMETAIPLVADAYGIPGGLVNVAASSIHHIGY
ncbi:hypothetical protein ACWFN4_30045 [Bacillus mycoides]